MSLFDDPKKEKIDDLRRTIKHLVKAIEDARAMLAVQSGGDADLILQEAVMDKRFKFY